MYTIVDEQIGANRNTRAQRERGVKGDGKKGESDLSYLSKRDNFFLRHI